MNADTLRQLIANCRRSRERVVGWNAGGLPSDWCPHKILNPKMPRGYYFSDASAWEFIADTLEGGHEYEVIQLDVPAGAIALVMQVKINGYDRPLYIKIQVGARNKAIGRSFHISHIAYN